MDPSRVDPFSKLFCASFESYIVTWYLHPPLHPCRYLCTGDRWIHVQHCPLSERCIHRCCGRAHRCRRKFGRRYFWLSISQRTRSSDRSPVYEIYYRSQLDPNSRAFIQIETSAFSSDRYSASFIAPPLRRVCNIVRTRSSSERLPPDRARICASTVSK